MEELPQIVNNAAMLTLLGGGSVQQSDFDLALNAAPVLVAADGGATAAFKFGHAPSVIVGDLDSVDQDQARSHDVPMVYLDDQNSNDLEKCLGVTKARVVLGVGFLGGRLDHELAALNALAQVRDRCVVLIGSEDVVFRVPQRLSLPLEVGTRVSLFPLSEVAATSTGLQWALDGLPFAPNGQIGCSNMAVSADVQVDVARGDMLMILPKHLVMDVVDAVGAAFEINKQVD